MSLTKEQIKARVASALEIVPLGQSLESQDSTRLDQAYTEIYEELESKELAIWAINDPVPSSIANYVINLIAVNCLLDYPQSTEKNNLIYTTGASALSNIRKVVYPTYISTDLPKDY